MPGLTTPAPTRDDAALERETMRRVGLRLLPFLFVLYIFNFLDRTNVALAALQMNRDLSFSSTAFGLGAGIFFVGYALFEVPSNMLLIRVGARRWIARIMISWGLIAAAMMFVRTPFQFYSLRLLLGIAEAGFFPGIVYYLTQWFPAKRRARASSRFMIAIPLSGVLGGVLGGFLLSLDGRLGLAGWQWLFLVEGLPSAFIGITVLRYLTDQPRDAHWLTAEQRAWLIEEMRLDKEKSGAAHEMPALRALAQPVIWLLALPYFLVLTAGYGYTFWSPIVIRDTLHTTDTQTALLTAVFAVCSMLAMLAVGASSDRTGERLYHAAFGGILIAVGFTGAALLPHPVLRILALALVLVGSNSMLPSFWCLPSMVLSGSAAAVGIALINSLGNTGGFVGPYVIGFVKDRTGGNTGSFLILAALGAICAVVCILLKRHPAFAAVRPRASSS
ncbi:MAG: MFS transporter [Gemmatimonadota bacterium]|nr:MFS transporter [Gemmatimonadota bacterium]